VCELLYVLLQGVILLTLPSVSEQDNDLFESECDSWILKSSIKVPTDVLYSICVNANGELLASSATGKEKDDSSAVILWNTANNQPVSEIKTRLRMVEKIDFAPKAKQVVISGYPCTSGVEILDFAKKSILTEIQDGLLGNHVISPDGKRIAAGTKSRRVGLWDLETTKLQDEIGHSWEQTKLAFGPNGKLLAFSCRDNSVEMWDVGKKTKLYSLIGHTDVISCLTFNPNGSILASSSSDGTLRFWDIETGRACGVRNPRYGIGSMCFSRSGATLIASGWTDATVFMPATPCLVMWEVNGTRQRRCPMDDVIMGLSMAENGKTLCVGLFKGNVLIWRFEPVPQTMRKKD
jgi:WD40 repeat protein